MLLVRKYAQMALANMANCFGAIMPCLHGQLNTYLSGG